MHRLHRATVTPRCRHAATGWYPWRACSDAFGFCGVHDLCRGKLGLLLDFSVAEALPSEIPRRGQLPLLRLARLLGINAEDLFNAAAGEFVERDLPGFTKLLSLREDIVGQLDLNSIHADLSTADRMPSIW